MRLSNRRLILGLGAVAALGVVIYAARAPLAEPIAVAALKAQGFVAPHVRIKDIGFDRLVLSRLTAGAGARPDLDLSHVDIRFSLFEALAGKFDRVAVGPGTIVARLSKDSAISIAGYVPKPDSKSKGAPFAALAIESLALSLVAPAGKIKGTLDGAFSVAYGGAFQTTIAARRLTAGGVALDGLKGDGALRLAADGGSKLTAALRADAASPFGAAKDIAIAFDGRATSWREALNGAAEKLAGAGTLTLRSAAVTAHDAPDLAAATAIVAPFQTLRLSGGLDLAYRNGVLAVTAPAGAPALVAASDIGARFTVAADYNAAVFRMDASGAALALSATLDGPVSGALTAKAIAAAHGAWRYAGDLSLAPSKMALGAGLDLNLGGGHMALAGTADAALTTYEGTLRLDAALRRLSAGDFTVSDAAASAALRYAADVKAGTAEISSDNGSCAIVAHAGLAAPGVVGAVRGLSLCPADGPILAATSGKAAKTTIRTRITIASLTATPTAPAGKGAAPPETMLIGAPPTVDISADIETNSGASTFSAIAKGGRLTLPGAAVLSAVDLAIRGAAGRSGFTGDARLGSAALADVEQAKRFAPLSLSGEARADQSAATAAIAVKTLRGQMLGRGDARLDLHRQAGAAHFELAALKFSPNGLQITELLPPLRGLVGGATGEIGGAFDVQWGAAPNSLFSGGAVDIRNLSFRGPGVAVSQTGQLTGTLKFSSLAPLTTAGVQTLKIGLVDMGALKLENGVAEFALPGDGRLILDRAEFPWFGGRIGVYDATSSLDAAKTTFNLRADDIDLKAMFDYAKIDGLSGEGVIAGTLPLAIEGGRSFIRNGELHSKTPGVIHYQSPVSEAAANSSGGAKLALDILRNLHFAKLGAKIDGPLDGDLSFKLTFEGDNDVSLNKTTIPASPVVYRLSIEAPLLALLEQAQVSTDTGAQLERAGIVPKKSVKE